MSAGIAIESALFSVLCAALDDRLRPVLERLDAIDARIAKLEPDDEGLTFKQAGRMLGVSSKTIGRWVDAGKIAAGGGTPRSPRILRSEVRRVLEGREVRSDSATASSSGNGLDMTALARSVLSSRSKPRRKV